MEDDLKKIKNKNRRRPQKNKMEDDPPGEKNGRRPKKMGEK